VNGRDWELGFGRDATGETGTRFDKVTEPQHSVSAVPFYVSAMFGDPRHVLATTIGLLLTLAIAVSILAVVALPNLRNGSRLLTPDGERALVRAKEQARQKPVAAAGQTWRQTLRGMILTWRGLVVARRSLARRWAPLSARLHGLFDQLEGREGAQPAPGIGADSDAEVDEQADAQAQAQADGDAHAGERFDPAASAGRRGIGRPRPVPPISGPIPVDHDPDADTGADTGEDASEDTVIDLRTPADLDAGAGQHRPAAARHAR
jgi:hypothetical protein